METLRDRLVRLRRALPSASSSVTLSGSDLDELIGETEAAPALADMTVAEVAEILKRAPSTVRGWCSSGVLRSYLFRGREYRITREALREFQDRQARGEDDGPGGDDPGWDDV